MTRAPTNLLAVRDLLLTHLNVDKTRARDDDLEPAELGVIGDQAHRGGYHCGSDRVVTNDYSVVESARDKTGLTLDAAALDVGMFEVRTPKGTFDLPHFSRWCVQQCTANAADTRDIREVIYSPDGRTVKRWDRLKRRTSGDKSHLWHTHFSFHRDAIKAGRDQTPLFRRYLTSIGLPAGKDDDMDAGQFAKILDDPMVAVRLRRLPWQYVGGGIPAGMSTLGVLNAVLLAVRTLGDVIAQESASPEEVRALLDQIPQPTGDVPAIVAGVLAGLDPARIAEAVAEALPAEQARRIADELAARLAD